MAHHDVALWALTDAIELLRNAERFEQRVVALDSSEDVPCWRPATDVYEYGKELRLVVALPGVDPTAISLTIENNALVVRGERPIPPACRLSAIHRLEIPYGRFERKIRLPNGNFQLHQEYIDHGCLVLLLRNLGP